MGPAPWRLAIFPTSMAPISAWITFPMEGDSITVYSRVFSVKTGTSSRATGRTVWNAPGMALFSLFVPEANQA